MDYSFQDDAVEDDAFDNGHVEDGEDIHLPSSGPSSPSLSDFHPDAGQNADEPQEASSPSPFHQREKEFGLLQLFEPHYDFSELDSVLTSATVTEWNRKTRHLPMHVLIAMSMNDYLARSQPRGKLRHSWGVEKDEGVVVYADIVWTANEAKEYIALNPLQRLRCCAAWATAFWSDPLICVSYLLCPRETQQVTKKKTSDQFTVTYQDIDRIRNAPVLIWIASRAKLICTPLKDLLDCSDEQPKQGPGPWISEATQVRAIDDAGQRRPNFHWERTWYYSFDSPTCTKWAMQRALEGDGNKSMQEKLHGKLLAKLEEDLDRVEPASPVWRVMYNRLML